MKLSLIFVYGSLKRGRALHHVLHCQQSCGEAVTEPLYRLFDLGSYPGLIEWPAGLAIRGEIYRVDAACLERLDDVEGVAESLYARRRIFLQSPFSDDVVHAWFWLHPVSGLPDCGVEWPCGAEG